MVKEAIHTPFGEETTKEQSLLHQKVKEAIST